MRRWILPTLLACAAAGCDGASSESGVTAYLRLTNAQFVPGALQADPMAMGPKVALNLGIARVHPGVQNLPLSGNVTKGTSALIGLANDSGHWIVPAPLRDPQEIGMFQFSARMSLSPDLPLDPPTQTLLVRGVDAQGLVGPSQQFSLKIEDPIPAGALVFTLEWDTNADLDLHVLVPNTPDPLTGAPRPPVEVWGKNPVGVSPPVQGEDRMASLAAAARLDHDSNAACAIDGIRRENVIFAQPPPAGQYIVRVDAFSMCGQAAAQWKVSVTTPTGPLRNPATWIALDPDTRGAHGPGAGRLALDFTL